MKKLTKIKLVNWHLFSNQTIEIRDNTLISGENGSGKSTLLDAVQYLLVGGRGGAKFNIAATDDAKRTLEGYVRGRIGAENKEFIREGDVVSHVAMEFFDTKTEEYAVLGVILDLPKNSNIKERFYLMENVSSHESLYIDEKNFPRDYRSMKGYLKDNFKLELRTFDTQRLYREGLSRFFGMDAGKYAKILPKALAFKSIDLQDFVYDFLLDDDPIDIKALKNNVAQLKKIEAQIKKDREKLEKLDEIVDLGETFQQNQSQQEINRVLESLNWIERREDFIKNSESEIARIDQRLDSFRSEKQVLDGRIDDNDKSMFNLESSKQDNDLNRTIANYQSQLDKKEEEYNLQREVVQEIKVSLVSEVTMLKELVMLIPNQNIKSFLGYYQTTEDNLDPKILTDYLTEIASDLMVFKEEYSISRNKIESEKNEVAEKIRMAKYRLNQLRRNVKTYPQHVDALIKALNEGLSERYHTEIRISPLCELIEVNENLWRNAVEGYLGGQRFDLIVDPEYFDAALQIYDEVKLELGIFGVGLVNTNKIRNFNEITKGSLAAKVTTDHTYARFYINMLLNSLVCEENIHNLKNHGRAITPSGMTYLNHTARQINPRIYEIPYIGKQATGMQIELELNDISLLETKMEEYYQTTELHVNVLRHVSQSKSLEVVQQNKLRFLEQIKQTRRDFTILEEQLNSLEKDVNLQEIDKQIDAGREVRRQLRLDSDRLVGEIATNRDSRHKVVEGIEEAKAKITDFAKEKDALSKNNPNLVHKATTQYYGLKTAHKNSYDEISSYITTSNVRLQTTVIKQETEIKNLMKSYDNLFHFGSAPEIDSLPNFISEANIIRNNNLVKFEEEATELRRNSEIGFKEEFVNKLRASIETAKQQIEELNSALDGKTFGSDSYKLITIPSIDPQYERYYDIIMGIDSLSSQGLFTESLTQRNERILNELFDIISSTAPEHDKISYQLLDYRNYMSYDIEVNNVNGNKSFFSKVSREKSGGETQVPFYIVIAASFQQLLTRNKNVDAGCIVLFDEAFNNMDESRIDAMMKFYNSLSIQLLIAIPPQRVSNILPFVSTSLAIIKENDLAIVEAFDDQRGIM